MNEFCICTAGGFPLFFKLNESLFCLNIPVFILLTVISFDIGNMLYCRFFFVYYSTPVCICACTHIAAACQINIYLKRCLNLI